MKTWIKVVIGVVIVCLFTVLFAVISVVGLNNECVQMEAGIKAQYSQNQNNYDSMWKKFKEATQVTTLYTDDLKKVYDSAIQGRYGANGSKAIFQWLKENNPNFDSSIYKNLQVMIEGGRNTFESNQKMLLDKKMMYEVQLQSFPGNLVARTLGFPKIDLTKFDIVISEATNKAFESKQVDEVKLR